MTESFLPPEQPVQPPAHLTEDDARPARPGRTPEDPDEATHSGAADPPPADPPAEPVSQQSSTVDPLVDVSATLVRLVAEFEKHHQRAAHRESVIDNLHAELEKLRTGERRGVVRPLLASLARLRDDMLKQATSLPDEFDAARAQKLLRSFADSIEITLEDFGIGIYTPELGGEYDPRCHKAVSSAPTADPALVRRIADVRKDGYQDTEIGAPLTQAEVIVYVVIPDSVDNPST
jgi:molecular chaperone GrpE